MKKSFVIISLTLFAALLLLLSACGGDNNDSATGLPDITPANYDWQIIIMDGDEGVMDGRFAISCHWLGESSAVTDEDDFSIRFNNEAFPLENFGMGSLRMIFGTASLNPGTSYDVEFYKNNQQLSKGTIKTPYRAQGSFPATFNPHEAASFNWTLGNNNQYQSVILSASGEGLTEDDDFDKELSPSMRSYTFPANTVQDYGAETSYSMGVVQYSFLKKGRTAIIAAQSNHQNYGAEQPGKLDKNQETEKLLRRLIARH